MSLCAPTESGPTKPGFIGVSSSICSARSARSASRYGQVDSGVNADAALNRPSSSRAWTAVAVTGPLTSSGVVPLVILSGAEGGVEESEWSAAAPIPDGGTFVGATGATLPDGRLAVVGGVNRAIFARALHNTPEDRIPYLSKEPAEYQFRKDVYAFDPATETWSLLSTDPACALAGLGVAAFGANALYVAGGELKPGVRSPRIFTLHW